MEKKAANEMVKNKETGILMVVDDDGNTLRMIKKILEKKYKVFLAPSGEKALSVIKKERPDLILLDILMPGMDGFETYEELRKYEDETGGKHVPVIFLTGSENGDFEKQGLDLGACDFVRKPFNEDVLMNRIQNAITNNRTIENLKEEATVDKLTGFLNKNAGEIKIASMCNASAGAMAIMDIDNFKLVNDLFGHDSGDKVLRAFSTIIKHNTRGTDVVSRIGGDEFLAFFPDMAGKESLSALSGRLNKQMVSETMKLLGPDNGIPIGISIGAVMIPQHGRIFDSLFAMADDELCKVKQNGKHGFSIYSGETAENNIASHDLKREIDRISKIIDERNEKDGALILGKESFSIVSRFVTRFYKRYGGSSFKILFEIIPKKDHEGEFKEISSAFGNMLQQTLRRSDIILQHKTNQYFVLLTERNQFEIDAVVKRVVDCWNQNESSPKATIRYEYKFLEREDIRSKKEEMV